VNQRESFKCVYIRPEPKYLVIQAKKNLKTNARKPHHRNPGLRILKSILPILSPYRSNEVLGACVPKLGTVVDRSLANPVKKKKGND
jgi:hypothetical protein